MRLTLEKVLVLKSVDLLSSVPEDALVEVASILEELEAGPGEEIIRQGDMGTTMYVIVEGRVKVHADGQNLAELGPREVFGELAALDPQPRAASVTALEPTDLFRISRTPFLELMAVHPDVATGVLKVLCHRLRQTR